MYAYCECAMCQPLAAEARDGILALTYINICIYTYIYIHMYIVSVV